MEISEVLKEKQLSAVDINKTTAVQLNNKVIDKIISDYSDLTGGGKDMSGWYASMLRKLGASRFTQLAGVARADGKDPARYFSWLLKQE